MPLSPCGRGGSRRCAAVPGVNEKLAALELGPGGERMLSVSPGMRMKTSGGHWEVNRGGAMGGEVQVGEMRREYYGRLLKNA